MTTFPYCILLPNLHLLISRIMFAGATRGGKRGGRGRDDQGDANEYSQTKPSAGVSLFDFLEEKIPGGGGATSKPEDERPKPNSANSRNNGNGGKFHDFNCKIHELISRISLGPQNRDRDRGQQQQQRYDKSNNTKNHQNKPNTNRTNKPGGGRDSDPKGNQQGGPRQHDQHRGQGDRHDRGGQGQDRRRNDQGDRDQGAKRRGEHPRGNRVEDSQRPPRHQQQQHHQQQLQHQHQQQPQQHNGGRGPKGQQRASSDRDFGEWSNSTYHESQRNHHQEALTSITATLNHMNLSNQQHFQDQQQRMFNGTGTNYKQTAEIMWSNN